MIDWQRRIARYLRPDGSVVVPPRIAKLLDRRVGILPEQRIMLRAADPEAYSVLMALRLAALGRTQNPFSVAASGQNRAVRDSYLPSSEWLTTPAAAEQLGVSERTMRRWVTAQRIPARKHGGRWLINSRDLGIAQALAAA
ncbi:helix-turn-helix domain-containing protein [Mycobacterium bourgelatii]|nr:helix-turn-helix domain-containing protein [Mycobacterium bourgelatii]MCV6975329.1 helix-turn-helix domain-containing protein [Mycobacterium bourgelatii]